MRRSTWQGSPWERAWASASQPGRSPNVVEAPAASVAHALVVSDEPGGTGNPAADFSAAAPASTPAIDGIDRERMSRYG